MNQFSLPKMSQSTILKFLAKPTALVVSGSFALALLAGCDDSRARTTDQTRSAGKALPNATEVASTNVLKSEGVSVSIATGGNWRVDKNDQGRRIDVRFSSRMPIPNGIPADEYGGDDSWSDDPAAIPVTFEPALALEARWINDGLCQLRIAEPAAPSTRYDLSLKSDLVDRDGQLVKAPELRAAFVSRPFEANWINVFDQTESSHLTRRPMATLEFTHPVTPQQIADLVAFQIRETRERIPAQVILKPWEDGSPQERFQVYAERDMPADVGVNLVVERLDAADQVGAGSRLAHLLVEPIGRTSQLDIDFVMARHQPILGTSVLVKFNQDVDPDSVSKEAFRVTPEVADLEIVTNGLRVELRGSFDPLVKYRVAMASEADAPDQSVKSIAGYGLGELEDWGATFPSKRPAVLMPDRELMLFQASGEIRVPFVQCSMHHTTFSISPVPVEKITGIMRRLEATEQNERDGYESRELDDDMAEASIAESFELLPALRGEFGDTADGAEIERVLELPAKDLPSGSIFLVEVEGFGYGEQKRRAGNACLIAVDHHAVLRKSTRYEDRLRILGLDDGLPVDGAKVRIFEDGKVTASSQKAKNGWYKFSNLRKADYAEITDPSGATTVRFVDRGSKFTSGSGWTWGFEKDDEWNAKLFSDRGVYRPGESVRLKGIVRNRPAGNPGQKMELPKKRIDFQWTISGGPDGEDVAKGQGKTTAQGGYEIFWQIPAELEPGSYYYEDDIGGGTSVLVYDFRPPLFTVKMTAEDFVGTTATATVDSQYFFLEPNAGARVEWEARWMRSYDSDASSTGPTPVKDGTGRISVDIPWGGADGLPLANSSSGDDYVITDWFSRDSLGGGMTRVEAAEIRLAGSGVRIGQQDKAPREAVATGTAELDADGRVVLTCESPFPENSQGLRTSIRWSVKVTSIEGQTINSGTRQYGQFHDALHAIQLRNSGEGQMTVDVAAIDLADNSVSGVESDVTVFRMSYDTVVEKVGSGIIRYINEPNFEQVWNGQLTSPASQKIDLPGPGRYVALARDPAKASANRPPVSASRLVGGPGRSGVRVDGPTALRVTPVKDVVRIGEEAVLEIESPFPGQALITIESSEIHYQRQIELPGDASQVRIPMLDDYFPNATICVHVFRGLDAADGDPIASEAFGFTSVEVQDPSLQLALKPELDRDTLVPGETLSGSIQVTAEGAPVAGVEVTVFAVDQSIQKVSNWKMPNLVSFLQPKKPYALATYPSLDPRHGYRYGGPDSLMQKGYIVGGGGGKSAAGLGGVARTNFDPLAFWAGALETDAQGRVEFSFEVPDTLTNYRLAAVAHKGRATGTAETSFVVKKDLWITPAFPNFLRQGDQLEIAASINQKKVANAPTAIECTISDGLTLESDAQIALAVRQEIGSMARFKASVADDAAALGEVKIRLGARSAKVGKHGDAVELAIPVLAAGTVRDGFLTGIVPEGRFVAAGLIPEEWRQASSGEAEILLSSSSDLPRLLGIPQVMDYPHGCLEQRSSKILSQTLFPQLLSYLPSFSGESRERYLAEMEDHIDTIRGSIIVAGSWDSDLSTRGAALPYWEGSRRINPFATVQATWAMLEFARAKVAVGEEISRSMRRDLRQLMVGLRDIAENRGDLRAGRTIRAYALMVLSQYLGNGDFNLSGDQGDPILSLEADDLAKIHQAAVASGDELYLHRDTLGDDGVSFLALALNRLGVLPDQQNLLIGELGTRPDLREFQPNTFGSQRRNEALRLVSRIVLKGDAMTDAELADADVALLAQMETSADLSNQENFWLLYAFTELRRYRSQSEADLSERVFTTVPEALSPNKQTAVWRDRAMVTLKDTEIGIAGEVGGANALPLGYVVRASYELPPELVERRADGGVSIDRVVHNLSRPDAPAGNFKVGDDLLVTYIVESDRAHSYAVVEDHLAACIEAVNPDLPSVGRFYTLPPEVTQDAASLSHVVRENERVRLYFDDLAKGTQRYSILVRITAAGSFQWPATQFSTMYDSRFRASTASGRIKVSSME